MNEQARSGKVGQGHARSDIASGSEVVKLGLRLKLGDLGSDLIRLRTEGMEEWRKREGKDRIHLLNLVR